MFVPNDWGLVSFLIDDSLREEREQFSKVLNLTIQRHLCSEQTFSESVLGTHQLLLRQLWSTVCATFDNFDEFRMYRTLNILDTILNNQKNHHKTICARRRISGLGVLIWMLVILFYLLIFLYLLRKLKLQLVLKKSSFWSSETLSISCIERDFTIVLQVNYVTLVPLYWTMNKTWNTVFLRKLSSNLQWIRDLTFSADTHGFWMIFSKPFCGIKY